MAKNEDILIQGTDEAPVPTELKADSNPPMPIQENPGPRQRRTHTLGNSTTSRHRGKERTRQRNDLSILMSAQNERHILTGVIQGIERCPDNPADSLAVLYQGAYKIIIPTDHLLEIEPERTNSARGGMVSRRLGAEIDYIIVGVDAANHIAVASRREAMNRLRKHHFLYPEQNENYPIMVGDFIEARIVSVIQPGIFVEVFGVECFIPMEELSYQRWTDATKHFKVGNHTLVQVLSLTIDDEQQIAIELSVKRTDDDRIIAMMQRYIPENIYLGQISMIYSSGIFVSFGEVGCFCKHPRRGRFTVGNKVTVRILGANMEEKRIWGAIVN